MSNFKQAVVSLLIRCLVIGAVAVVNTLLASYKTISLPDPGLTVPLLGLILSEADTWLVDYEGKLPLPTAG